MVLSALIRRCSDAEGFTCMVSCRTHLPPALLTMICSSRLLRCKMGPIKSSFVTAPNPPFSPSLFFSLLSLFFLFSLFPSCLFFDPERWIKVREFLREKNSLRDIQSNGHIPQRGGVVGNSSSPNLLQIIG
ncbi:hypothetical protein CPSG_08133 [Coccidioides posadasii str. Silveira]|uniref:Uncharacterized protein n=1 Tax=Coccidioides posadasii (strain RMSCC 757 / Silveira) TaxID=443226 RepID=E9DDH1_COCPS|nr:hypothetical protein CPSG_08133 [Coccidioides posadasii str. Silveira]